MGTEVRRSVSLYLSSDRIGNRGAELAAMLGLRPHVAVVRNAADHSLDAERHRLGWERERASLASLGISSAALDLRDYFGSPHALRKALLEFGGLWVVGGNTLFFDVRWP